MAVTTTPLNSTLMFVVQKDSGSGSVSRKYSDLKTDATEQDVFDIGTLLSNLQTNTLLSIQRSNVIEIEASV